MLSRTHHNKFYIPRHLRTVLAHQSSEISIHFLLLANCRRPYCTSFYLVRSPRRSSVRLLPFRPMAVRASTKSNICTASSRLILVCHSHQTATTKEMTQYYYCSFYCFFSFQLEDLKPVPVFSKRLQLSLSLSFGLCLWRATGLCALAPLYVKKREYRCSVSCCAAPVTFHSPSTSCLLGPLTPVYHNFRHC